MSKLLTITKRILTIAATLHTKAIIAHRRSLSERITRCEQIRTAAYDHYLTAVSAHDKAMGAAVAFDDSLSQPIVVEHAIRA